MPILLILPTSYNDNSLNKLYDGMRAIADTYSYKKDITLNQ